MKTYMLRNILKMSLEERQELLDFVYKTIERENREFHCAIRGGILLGYIEEILGHRIDLVGRESMDVWARTMVAYQMTQEGFTNRETGTQLMKDHSTVSYLNHKMQDALDMPKAYRDILPIWNQFQKRIQDDIHERTIGDPVSI